MGTYKCYWQGGPLDPYRQACLASYHLHGHSVELYSRRAPSGLPPGVTSHSLEGITTTTLLEAQLFSNEDARGTRQCWIPIDQLWLRQQASTATSKEPQSLAWVEAFKLWLPEYQWELKNRFQATNAISIHLSFADMAGIDLHYLPPPGSFLYTILDQHEKTYASAPRPILNEQEVRRRVQNLLDDIQPWTQSNLIRCCGERIIKDLGLMPPPQQSKGSFRSNARSVLLRLAQLFYKSYKT